MFDSQECTWSDISVKLFDATLKGLRGVRYKKEVEKEHLYAAGNEPVGIQSGNNKYDGSLKLLKNEVSRMNQAARAAGYKDISEVPAQLVVVTVNYKEAFNRPTQTDILRGVAFTGYEKGMDQGGKFMEIELPFLFMGLTEL